MNLPDLFDYLLKRYNETVSKRQTGKNDPIGEFVEIARSSLAEDRITNLRPEDGNVRITLQSGAEFLFAPSLPDAGSGDMQPSTYVRATRNPRPENANVMPDDGGNYRSASHFQAR